MALGSGYAQDRVKPLTKEALTKTIDSFATGDPLSKQPLSLGDDAALLPDKKEESKDDKGEKKVKGPTEITSNAATFDNRVHTAVFIGEVIVIDPEFNVKCDKLTAYLKHADKGNPESAAAPVGKPAPKPPGDTPRSGAAPGADSKGGGLEKATAEMDGDGRVVITQDKVEADGAITHSIGTARKALYDAKTGDITLTGSPAVQQGFNTQMATREDTIMILNRVGLMRAIGPSKTVITGSTPDPGSSAKPRKTSTKEAPAPNLLNR